MLCWPTGQGAQQGQTSDAWSTAGLTPQQGRVPDGRLLRAFGLAPQLLLLLLTLLTLGLPYSAVFWLVMLGGGGP